LLPHSEGGRGAPGVEVGENSAGANSLRNFFLNRSCVSCYSGFGLISPFTIMRQDESITGSSGQSAIDPQSHLIAPQ
jgi:hypothetical protein